MNTLRRFQGIVAIATLAIGAGGVSRAQSPPAEQKQKPAAKKKTEAAPKPAAEDVKEKGPGEGIQVHGHWTIEVKDPDGKVATHREFENSLVTGAAGAGPFLANVLLGSGAAGGFALELIQSTTAGTQQLIIYPGNNDVLEACGNGFTLPAGEGICSTTLSAATPITNGFSLSGQIASTTANPILAGTITQVATLSYWCTNSSTPSTYSPSACYNAALVGTGAVLWFGQFTSATLTPDTATSPVPVSTGQTIQVTVAITFM